MNERPYISEETKRLVRQRCGFGCVACGIPIYHYDHIEEFSKTGDDAPENLTLLCPNHHDDKSRGRTPPAVVEKWNKKPFNRSAITSKPHMISRVGKAASFAIGGLTCDLSGDYAAALVLDGQIMVGCLFNDDWMLFDLTLRDEKGRLALQIFEGELIYSLDQWDVRYVGNTLIIRSASLQSLTVNLKFTENGFVLTKGIFIGDFHRAIINSDSCHVFENNGSPLFSMRGVRISQIPIGLLCGDAGHYTDRIFHNCKFLVDDMRTARCKFDGCKFYKSVEGTLLDVTNWFLERID